ncbi:MAG: DOMON-like domain-containing protein [Sphingomonas sp.]|uniref:DOMON-like domain-containing protein n=1 Tax=Sphingomonas sp. TaxID=28214 RepID=UPI0025E2AA49|nr:DOMON-like domain-containing protein [Sphingomonas sp.]MBX3564910.1 DOMON-like domain-containing protein [Sphingomonas sp.]
MKLIAHPASPASAVSAVEAEIIADDGDRMLLRYRVRGPLKLPELESPGRADDLWKTTCLELFLQPAGSDSYVEFNFSPSCRWAAYDFDNYRRGRRDKLLSIEPHIERVDPADDNSDETFDYVFDVDVELSDFPKVPLRMGITAVIEEPNGTISYWALAHPEGKADFHDPACFALTL